MNTRECIFCGSKELSREHIYPRWLFNVTSIPTKNFKPSTHIIRRSESNTLSNEFVDNISDGRVIRADDFTVKMVCINCNGGWMSDLELKVKPIFTNLLNDSLEVEEIDADSALALSQWAVLKLMLISLTAQQKVIFSKMAYSLIQKGIIPEGFLVEAINTNSILLCRIF